MQKENRKKAQIEAEALINYVRKNCTQSPEMLAFLDQKYLKEDIEKILYEVKELNNPERK